MLVRPSGFAGFEKTRTRPPSAATIEAWQIGSGSAGSRVTALQVSPPSVDLDSLLANPVALSPVAEEETLQCVDYSGPCFFMNHPTGQAPLHSVPGAKLQPRAQLRPASLPLRPFSLQFLLIFFPFLPLRIEKELSQNITFWGTAHKMLTGKNKFTWLMNRILAAFEL